MKQNEMSRICEANRTYKMEKWKDAVWKA